MSNTKYSDKQLEKKFGRREEGTPLFFPQELGYRCPEGHSNLQFSEFIDHIWCYTCKQDYHYAKECVLVADSSNPKGLPEQPKIITGIKNWSECGNYCPNIPKKLIEEAK